MHASDHTDHQAHHQSDHHKAACCVAGGTCCSGAFALNSVIAWVPAEAQFEATAIAPAPLVTGFIPDGLERPPRHLSSAFALNRR
jgi:hypothetical protein